MKKIIDEAVASGIRKTINRFREHPLYYFTESDIHTSLKNDILEGNSTIFYYKNKISLIHHEYPTNFRFYRKDLLNKIKNECIDGKRGHFDLAILNRQFVIDQEKKGIQGIRTIINKDIKNIFNIDDLQYNLICAIEIKYIHEFNKKNQNMLEEVKKDIAKLSLALDHSKNSIVPINLIFSSSKSEYNVAENIKVYLKDIDNLPKGIINVFIESYFDSESKRTPKTEIFYNSNSVENKPIYNLLSNIL